MVSRPKRQGTLETPENHSADGANAWSTYWASGALHSCAGSFAENYDGVIGQTWAEFFRALPNGARVLDIASGNGPLAQLMLTTTPDAQMHCTCIDLASVSPAWISALSPHQRTRVTFRPRTAMEQLDAPDGPFDAVMSQFGVEYGDWQTMIQRLPVLLHPSARLQFICHAKDSAIVTAGDAEKGHLEWLLKPAGLLDTAKAMVPLMALAGTDAGRTVLANNRAADETRSRYDTLLSEANYRVAHLPVGDVLSEVDQHCAKAFQTAVLGDPSQAMNQINQLEAQLYASCERLTQLSAAALSEEQVAEIIRSLTSHGIHLSYQRLRDQNRLLGWRIKN